MLKKDLEAVVEALRDFVAATSDIKRWAQGHSDNDPSLKCSGPWPQPILIEEECDKLRAAYRKHADTLARLDADLPEEVGAFLLDPTIRRAVDAERARCAAAVRAVPTHKWVGGSDQWGNSCPAKVLATREDYARACEQPNTGNERPSGFAR